MRILEENVSKKELLDFLYYGMNYNDPNLYKQVNDSTFNIFQFSGNTASDMIKGAHPKNFDELTAINALSRPGSSFSYSDFIRNEDGESKYPQVVAQFLKDSHGCILFQEQIMKIVEFLTNGKVKGNDARKLLKALGKANKKQEDIDKWNKIVETIKEESKDKLSPSEIEMLASDLITLSSYSFNKSHAAAYTYMACNTLYMSYYFKNYFWAASLSYDATKLDVLKDSIKNANSVGIKILPPDVNKSNLHFTPTDEGITFGLNEIKGIGEEAAKTVIKNRPYTSLKDFLMKNIEEKSINKRISTALLGGGAFDSLFGKDERKNYLNILTEYYVKKKTKKDPEKLSKLWDEIKEEHSIIKVTTTNDDYIELETKYLGGNFFHGEFSPEMLEKIEKLHAIGRCLRNFQEVRESNLASAYCPVIMKKYRYHTQKNGEEMLFADCVDANGEEKSIPIFGSYFKFLKIKFFGESPYLLSLYPKGDEIMFGSRNFIKSPDTIRAMMIRWKI